MATECTPGAKLQHIHVHAPAALMNAEFVAGAVGAGAGIVIGQPLDTIRIRLQTQPVLQTQFRGLYTSAATSAAAAGAEVGSAASLQRLYSGILDCFLKIVRHEGVSGLFRGLMPPLTTVAAQNSILFSTYGASKRWWLEHVQMAPSNADISMGGVYFSGVVSGLTCSVVTIPSELVKCRLQVDAPIEGRGSRYSGSVALVRNIVATEGVTGLFRGSAVTIFRDSPSYGLYFWIYESVSRSLPPIITNARQQASNLLGYYGLAPPPAAASSLLNPSASSDKAVTVLLAGGIAGSTSWAAIYPLDVLKSRLQTQPQCYRHGIWDCYRTSVAAEGHAFLYKGLGATVLRAFPVNAVTFFTYEAMMQLLAPSSGWLD